MISAGHQFVSVCISATPGEGEAAGTCSGYNQANAYARCIMPTNGCVLIVDDDPQVRDMLCEYLGTHGYEVLQAGGGAAQPQNMLVAPPTIIGRTMFSPSSVKSRLPRSV